MRRDTAAAAGEHGGGIIGALVSRLKRYLVFRAHRGLGIGPLFERTTATEQGLARLERLVQEADQYRDRVEHIDSQITRIDTSLETVNARLERLEAGLGVAQTDGLNIVERRLIALAERLAESRIREAHGTDALAPSKVGLYTRPAPDESPIRFLITSFGYSASRWLGWALNLHPEVICTHGLNDAALGLVYDRDFTLDEWQHVFERQNDRRGMTLTEFFAELDALGPAKAYGNVHHFRIHELEHHTARENCRIPYTCAELIRHPVGMIESKYQANLNPQNPATRFDGSLPIFHENLTSHVEKTGCGQLVSRLHVDLASREVAMFFEAVRLAQRVGEEISRHPTQRFILMEKVTSDPQYFAVVFEMLFGGRLAADKKYLDEVFAGQALNRHRAAGTARPPKDDYAAWQPWQRAVVSRMIKKTIGVAHWERFGYDLNFLDKSMEGS